MNSPRGTQSTARWELPAHPETGSPARTRGRQAALAQQSTERSWGSCCPEGLKPGTAGTAGMTPGPAAGVPLPRRPGPGAHRPQRHFGCGGLHGQAESRWGATWARTAAAWRELAPPVGVFCLCRRHRLHGQRHCGAFLRCFRAVAAAQPPERAQTTPRLQAATPQPRAPTGSTPIVCASQQPDATGPDSQRPRGPPHPKRCAM